MANIEDEVDAFIFPTTQLPPPVHHFGERSVFDGHSDDISMQVSASNALPLMASFPSNPWYSGPDPVQVPVQVPAAWNQLMIKSGGADGFWAHNQEQPLLLCDGNNANIGEIKNEECCHEEKVVKIRRKRDHHHHHQEMNTSIGSSSKDLSRETICQYFYLPITQAAKQLNVGLDRLRKRCRELGIRRWPHRKLMSLQTRIKNVQEMGKEGGEGTDYEAKVREAIEILEQEKKLIEEVPDLQLEDRTKRLRQDISKANRKKRKLMAMAAVAGDQSLLESQYSYSFSHHPLMILCGRDNHVYGGGRGEEEMRCLMAD